MRVRISLPVIPNILQRFTGMFSNNYTHYKYIYFDEEKIKISDNFIKWTEEVMNGVPKDLMQTYNHILRQLKSQ
jgi:hypothetical protein